MHLQIQSSSSSFVSMTEPKKADKNGKSCYHCIEKDCTSTAHCRGNEDQCISKSGRNTSTTSSRWDGFKLQALPNKTLSLSGQGRGHGDQQGLRYQSGLRHFEQSTPEVGHRWRNQMLPRWLLQQRQQHERQPPAAGGAAGLFGPVHLTPLLVGSSAYLRKASRCSRPLPVARNLLVTWWTVSQTSCGKSNQNVIILNLLKGKKQISRLCIVWCSLTSLARCFSRIVFNFR